MDISAKDYLKDADKYILIDVRTKEEFESLHQEEAINAPMDMIMQNMEKIRKYKNIVLISTHGSTSAIAKLRLAEEGIGAINLIGGMKALIKAKLEAGQIDEGEYELYVGRL